MRSAILAAVCISALIGAASPARADTDEQKLAVARQMIEAWNTRNWERVYELFATDGVLHSMMQSPVVGREAIAARLGKLVDGVSEIELKVRHIGVIDGLVFVERVDEFVYRGHRGAVPVVGVLDVEDGRVKAWREYYDHAQLLREMGLVPAADAAQRHQGPSPPEAPAQ